MEPKKVIQNPAVIGGLFILGLAMLCMALVGCASGRVVDRSFGSVTRMITVDGHDYIERRVNGRVLPLLHSEGCPNPSHR